MLCKEIGWVPREILLTYRIFTYSYKKVLDRDQKCFENKHCNLLCGIYIPCTNDLIITQEGGDNSFLSTI